MRELTLIRHNEYQYGLIADGLYIGSFNLVNPKHSTILQKLISKENNVAESSHDTAGNCGTGTPEVTA
jgi:hypothetical protein